MPKLSELKNRNRKPPVEQAPPGVGGPGGELDNPAAETAADVLSVVTEPEPSDSFVDFFDDLQEDSQYIDVVRLKPETYKGDQVAGYCGRLEPGDRYFELRQKFGGGTFRLNVRDKVTGRMVTTGRVVVAGAPVLPPDTAGVADARPAVAGSPAAGPVVDFDIKGTKVPFALSPGLDGIKELILFTRAVDSAFPVKQDISEALLLGLLNNRKDDPLELLGRLRNAVPEIFGGGDGGGEGGGSNGWDILKEALRQAGPVLANLTAGGASPRRRPMPLPAAPADAPALPAPAEPVEKSEVAHVGVMNELQIAMAMLTELVKAFRLDPPKPADRVVAMLNMSFPLTADQRKKIAGYRQTAFDWCENQLADVFEESESARADFEPWFNTVFDSIVGGA